MMQTMMDAALSERRINPECRAESLMHYPDLMQSAIWFYIRRYNDVQVHFPVFPDVCHDLAMMAAKRYIILKFDWVDPNCIC